MSDGFNFHDLLEATTTGGQFSFFFNGEQVLRCCLQCDATFEQDDAGFAALHAHEFLAHGRATLFDWTELHNVTLRLFVVPSTGKSSILGWKSHAIDIWGVDDTNGVLHHLTHKHLYSDESYEKRSWKWKLSRSANGEVVMPNGPTQPLELSASTGAP